MDTKADINGFSNIIYILFHIDTHNFESSLRTSKSKGCSRNVATLFLVLFPKKNSIFASHFELPDRMLRKANKMRDCIGADYGLHKPMRRPKGMHWNTFWRLHEKIEMLESRAIIVRFGMFRRSLGNRYQGLLGDIDDF